MLQRESGHGDVLDLVEHALQTAERLEQLGCDDELIVAGLLHDLGDGRVAASDHASWAADLVRPLLGCRVASLIGAHADAKRYLCTTDPGYWGGLSSMSQTTMIEQGGLMSGDEVAMFAAAPWCNDALTLRRCDDAGKRLDYCVEEPERFLAVLQRVASRRGRQDAE
jgi:predicted HD phosphohydrolase